VLVKSSILPKWSGILPPLLAVPLKAAPRVGISMLTPMDGSPSAIMGLLVITPANTPSKSTDPLEEKAPTSTPLNHTRYRSPFYLPELLFLTAGASLLLVRNRLAS